MLSSPEKEASIECGEDDSASREGENDSSRPSRENSVAMFRLMKNQDELYRRQLDGIRQRIALQRVKTAKARRTN